MAITKHKLFKILINNGGIDLDSKILNEINEFLVNDNIIYINHSITTTFSNELMNIAEDIRSRNQHPDFFKYRIENAYCIISLVYKDLKDTVNDISNVSFKTQEVVRKNVETGEKLTKPDLNF